MKFITEDDIRSKNLKSGDVLNIAADERLTPSAAEYAAQARLRVEFTAGAGAACTCIERPEAVPGLEKCDCVQSQEVTYLDSSMVVPKNHPSIVMRGKLDTLLAQLTLVQTQFDPKNRLPGFLKECLADLRSWVLLTLNGEVSGAAVDPDGMGGMDVETLHIVSREPAKYLGLDHFAAEASMGGNMALLNWLRALVRETEVAAVGCSVNMDVVCALNRLSSAVYVLMLLALAAERGLEIKSVKLS